jgi:hypothetical protein
MWWRAATVMALFAGLAWPARADATKGYFVNVHDPTNTTGGIFIAQGDVNEGVLLHEGTPSRFECAELVEERTGSYTFYARAVKVPYSDPPWYIKVASLYEGVGSAMGGIARSQTSPDHCGAAGVVAGTRYDVAVYISLQG